MTKPLTKSRTSTVAPQAGDSTTGMPQASASVTTMPNCSSTLGKRSASAPPSTSGISRALR